MRQLTLAESQQPKAPQRVWINMIRRPSLLFAALALTLALQSVRAEEVLEEKAAEKNGVSLQLPKGWQSDDTPDARPLLKAHAPARDKDDTGDFQTLLIVTSDAGEKIDAKAQQARAAKDSANYKAVEEPKDTTIGGVEGSTFGGTFTVGSVKLRTRQYMLLKDNKIYTLTFMSLESKWDTYAPAIAAAAASFRIPAK